MNTKTDVRLVVLFAVIFSLATLGGPLASDFRLPSVVPAHASNQPCQVMGSSGACSELWYPAGPEMSTEQIGVFSAGCNAEYSSLPGGLFSSSPSIDLTDCPAPSGVAGSCSSSSTIYVTSAVSSNQYCYLICQPSPCSSTNSWIRAVNDAASSPSPYNGLPNYFTWLNFYNPQPFTVGTIRQGFSHTVTSENPYVAYSTSIAQDQYIARNVYDSLYAANPLDPSQRINWMTASTTLLSAVSYNGGLAGPPAGTCAGSCTYRFSLPSYLVWQEGRQVTAYDVAFSYLSLVGNGAPLGAGAVAMSGITILNPLQFDISVTSNGPSELQSLTGLPIIPGQWASNVGGSTWSNLVAFCSGRTACGDVQYTLSGSTVNCAGACSNFPAANMQVNTAWLSASYSPIAQHTFVGSGPWQCGTVSGTTGSGTCDTPVGAGSSATAFTLSAFTGYFRSSAQAATWIWSQESDQSGPALAAASAVGSCNNVAVNLAGTCGHWQQGIGNPGSGTIVSVNTVTTVDSFYLENWVSPDNWATGTPVGIGTFPPLLYIPSNGQAFDGSLTLTPSPGPPYNPTGCTTPNTFYNC